MVVKEDAEIGMRSPQYNPCNIVFIYQLLLSLFFIYYTFKTRQGDGGKMMLSILFHFFIQSRTFPEWGKYRSHITSCNDLGSSVLFMHIYQNTGLYIFFKFYVFRLTNTSIVKTTIAPSVQQVEQSVQKAVNSTEPSNKRCDGSRFMSFALLSLAALSFSVYIFFFISLQNVICAKLDK